MEIFSAFVGWVLFCIGNAFTGYYVWLASDAKKYDRTKQWHTAELISLMPLTIGVSIAVFGLTWDAVLFTFQMALIRLTVFNTVINLLRNKKIYYFSASSSIIDRNLKKYSKLAYFGAVLLNIVSICYLLLKNGIF